MKNRIRVAVSPLTNTIFVGNVLKAGTWGADKQDVTMECLNAVADHVRNFWKPVQVIDADTGKLIYTITVE